MIKIDIKNSKNYFTLRYASAKLSPIVIICPGGGYKFTSERESEIVADKFLSNNFHTAVLYYRESLDYHPSPILSLAYTVDYLKKQDLISKVIVLGFSAGGHLVASLGCHFASIKEYDCQFDLQVLCYPVITANPKYIHKGSFQALLGDNPDEKTLKYLSLEHQVKSDAPEAFIWHTADDKSVVVENSLLFAEALKNKGVPYQLHIFPHGPHGISLATKETSNNDPEKENYYVSKWLNLVIDYLNYKFIHTNQ